MSLKSGSAGRAADITTHCSTQGSQFIWTGMEVLLDILSCRICLCIYVSGKSQGLEHRLGAHPAGPCPTHSRPAASLLPTHRGPAARQHWGNRCFSDSQGNSGFTFVRHKLANTCLSTCLTEGRVAGTRQAILARGGQRCRCAGGDTPGPQSAGDDRGRLRPPRVSGGLAHG